MQSWSQGTVYFRDNAYIANTFQQFILVPKRDDGRFDPRGDEKKLIAE